MQIRVNIDEEFLGTFGTGTLLGELAGSGFSKGDEVTLVFHTSSLSYCRANNGPRSIIMSDYVPMCLIEDVLRIVEMGIIVKVEEKRKD